MQWMQRRGLAVWSCFSSPKSLTHRTLGIHQKMHTIFFTISLKANMLAPKMIALAITAQANSPARLSGVRMHETSASRLAQNL
jgi:hypothetical protein